MLRKDFAKVVSCQLGQFQFYIPYCLEAGGPLSSQGNQWCLHWENHQHKIDQETIGIKIQIEMLQKQVTINIANCNTTVICITFIVKGVL